MNLARCTELNSSLVIHILILEIIFIGAFKELYINYQTQNVAHIVQMFNLVQNTLEERLKYNP
jgi:RNAse (barnase) inhibitor barstar